MEYPKINSLWKRQGWYFDQATKKHIVTNPEGRQSFIIGDYACDEFSAINQWRVEEKIDGTNIRIFFTPCKVQGNEGLNIEVRFGGRTKDAHIPCHLLDYLQVHFTRERMHAAFPERPSQVILFGEGYGPKIQSGGGNYRKDPGFILFDVRVGDWWLKREDVRTIAAKLEVPAPYEFGILSEDRIVNLVKSRPTSLCSVTEQIMEGVVCRSEPLMLFRNGAPIMWKLKCKEF